MEPRKYYAMEEEGDTTTITIYGDITSWPWEESDVSAYRLQQQLEEITSENIHVYINSYGGEVAEGLAIYNALKRNKAKVTTHCDGFACSAASIVFMAGEERIIGEASLLMIHNAWTYAAGNAEELRKQADDLDTISQACANAYRAAVSISEEELNNLLKNETWINPQGAVEMGFATKIEAYEKQTVPAASARTAVMNLICEKSALRDKVMQDLIDKALARWEEKTKQKEEKPTKEKPKEEPTEKLSFLSALTRGKEEK